MAGPADLLATSREALGIEGERTVLLASLASNGADAPAVRLFADRAAAVDPSFVVNEANAETVGALCRHLDGMPLAIELAAARVTVMTPSELLAGLHDRFQLLSGGRRRQRHRTLEATLDWSYDLLGADEQRALRALGVFMDGFDLDAVAAVAGIGRPAAMNAVEALVAKSLVLRVEGGHRARFGLLETVKAYAEDRLLDAGEAADARSRHLSHFHALATVHGRTGFSELRLGVRLRPDRSNLAAAFEWAASSAQWVLAGELMAGSFAAYLFDGAALEARAAIERAIPPCEIEDNELADHLRVALLLTLVWLNDWLTIEQIGAALTTSPIPPLRVVGFTVLALVTSFTEHETGREQLTHAQSELDAALVTSPGLNTDMAAGLLVWIRARLAAATGDYETALRNTQAWLTQQMSADYFTTGATRGVKHAAVCQLLLGEPAAALETVAWLEQFGVPSSNSDEIRALANLALDNAAQAEHHIRVHAARAISGRLTGEACDSALLLAALAHAEEHDDIARGLLLHMGMGLEPATVVYSTHLAIQLGVTSEHAERQQLTLGYSSTSEQGLSGSRMAMAAVRNEFARRGWD